MRTQQYSDPYLLNDDAMFRNARRLFTSTLAASACDGSNAASSASLHAQLLERMMRLADMARNPKVSGDDYASKRKTFSDKAKWETSVKDGISHGEDMATCSIKKVNDKFLHATSRFCSADTSSPQGGTPHRVTIELEGIAAAVSADVLVNAVQNAVQTQPDDAYKNLMAEASTLLTYPLFAKNNTTEDSFGLRSRRARSSEGLVSKRQFCDVLSQGAAALSKDADAFVRTLAQIAFSTVGVAIVSFVGGTLSEVLRRYLPPSLLSTLLGTRPTSPELARVRQSFLQLAAIVGTNMYFVGGDEPFATKLSQMLDNKLVFNALVNFGLELAHYVVAQASWGRKTASLFDQIFLQFRKIINQLQKFMTSYIYGSVLKSGSMKISVLLGSWLFLAVLTSIMETNVNRALLPAYTAYQMYDVAANVGYEASLDNKKDALHLSSLNKAAALIGEDDLRAIDAVAYLQSRTDTNLAPALKEVVSWEHLLNDPMFAAKLVYQCGFSFTSDSEVSVNACANGLRMFFNHHTPDHIDSQVRDGLVAMQEAIIIAQDQKRETEFGPMQQLVGRRISLKNVATLSVWSNVARLFTNAYLNSGDPGKAGTNF